MTTPEAVILAVVEGLTEFLPVSSTGHMILTEAFMKMDDSQFNKMFIVNIQFGAILSVILLYWRRFFQSIDFYLKLFVAFIPAAILGFLLDDYIESLLSNVLSVAVALIIGGVILVFIDKIFHKQIEEGAEDEDTEIVNITDEFGVERRRETLKGLNVSWMQAFIIGCFQCIAMIPGVSRSASTIVGGMTQKLNIKRAAEFSFFLAVPTIFAASAYQLVKGDNLVITGDHLDVLLIGNAVSFVVGMIAIKFFIGLITRYGLRFFGYYRIAMGVLILILMAMGKLSNELH